ncbi:MAG: hypothetical protein LC768_00915 [Acidobacteria bacterium]|nr:hypothetical protein [Acidobacteriota bacterium]MCA1636896.1 hypothetical protein [Acidobacteriota bacterium]
MVSKWKNEFNPGRAALALNGAIDVEDTKILLSEIKVTDANFTDKKAI